jgi:hypothetical protein
LKIQHQTGTLETDTHVQKQMEQRKRKEEEQRQSRRDTPGFWTTELLALLGCLGTFCPPINPPDDGRRCRLLQAQIRPVLATPPVSWID